MGEPRGLSHILNPSAPSGETQRHLVNERPFEAYEENGRLYHAWRRGTYPYPTDEKERNRYDMIHHLVHCIILKQIEPFERDGYTFSQSLAKPMNTSQTPYSVLDLGCGSGIWASDISKRYPEASVVGVDLAGGQPAAEGNLQWRTPDSRVGPFDFETQDWPFNGNSFDLIHAAHLCGSISNWPRFLEKVKRYLRPKTGQIELFEIDYAPRCVDGSLPPGAPIHQWWNYMQHATHTKPIACPDAKRLLEAAGFVDVQELVFNIPFSRSFGANVRERNSGEWYRNLLTEVGDHFAPVSMINGLSMGPMTRNLGWSKAQVDHLVNDVLQCVENEDWHAFNVLHIWTARRPGSDENL